MADFKLTIANPKTGKCVQREVKEDVANTLMGKKIGDKIEGSSVGLEGYEFILSGGSDYCGFPMRNDVPGTGRKRIFAVEGIGMRKKGRGVKQKKTVCGNTIHDQINQINLKITKEGKENIFEAKKADAKEAPAKKADAPKEKPAEKKEEAKPEAKEEKKPEPKKEEVKEKKEAPKEEDKK